MLHACAGPGDQVVAEAGASGLPLRCSSARFELPRGAESVELGLAHATTHDTRDSRERSRYLAHAGSVNTASIGWHTKRWKRLAFYY